MANCPKCNTIIPNNAAFCHTCGAKIGVCSRCNTPLPNGAAFCGNCGNKIMSNFNNQNTSSPDNQMEHTCSNSNYTNYSQSYQAQESNHGKTTKDLLDEWKGLSKFNKKIAESSVGCLLFLIPFLLCGILWIENEHSIITSSIREIFDSACRILPSNLSQWFMPTAYEILNVIRDILPFIERFVVFLVFPLMLLFEIYSVFCSSIFLRDFYKWCSQKNYSFKHAIQNTLELKYLHYQDSSAKHEYSDSMEKCIMCLLYNENTSVRATKYILNTLNITYLVLSMIFLYPSYRYLRWNEQGVITTSLLKLFDLFDILRLNDSIVPVFIWSCIMLLFIITHTVERQLEKRIQKERDNWFNNNLPGYLPRLKNFIMI